jgi:hypothetical protein
MYEAIIAEKDDLIKMKEATIKKQNADLQEMHDAIKAKEEGIAAYDAATLKFRKRMRAGA